eukprot:2874606-Rhodomonas_salina.1
MSSGYRRWGSRYRLSGTERESGEKGGCLGGFGLIFGVRGRTFRGQGRNGPPGTRKKRLDLHAFLGSCLVPGYRFPNLTERATVSLWNVASSLAASVGISFARNSHVIWYCHVLKIAAEHWETDCVTVCVLKQMQVSYKVFVRVSAGTDLPGVGCTPSSSLA